MLIAVVVLGVGLATALGRRELRRRAAAIHRAEADGWLRRGDIVSAEAAYRGALRLTPGACDAWTGLGRSLLRQHRYDRAREACREALDCAPEDPGALECLGVVLFTIGDLEGAEPRLRGALAQDGGRREARLTLIRLLRRQGRPAEALDAAEEAVRVHGPIPILVLEQGAALLELDRPVEAVPVLTAVARGRPDMPPVWLHLAEACRRTGDAQGADDAIERYRRLVARAAHGTP